MRSFYRFRQRFVLLALAGMFSFSTTALAQKDSEKPKTKKESTAVAEVTNLMQDRDYDLAIKTIENTLPKLDADSDADVRARLMYLKGRALQHAKKSDAAAKAFEAVRKAYPQTDWAHRSALAQGVTLARQGNYQAAEKLYRDQAKWLLADSRKQEIAGLYIEFADSYFKPTDEEKKPNYQKALLFYQQAISVWPKIEEKKWPVQGQQAICEFRIARCYEEQKQYQQAAKAFAAFVKKYESEGRLPFEQEGSPDAAGMPAFRAKTKVQNLWFDSYERLGQVHLKTKNYKKSRQQWQNYLVELSKRPGIDDERIARVHYHIAETYQLPTPPNDESLDLGIAAVKRFLENYPQHPWNGKAELLAAKGLMHRGRYVDAAKRMESFLKKDGDQDLQKMITETDHPVAEARYLLGTCLLQQKHYDRAIAAWQDYLVKHPSHKYWQPAQQSIINTEFHAAAEARQKKKYADARKQWNTFLAKYPLDRRAAKILLEFGNMEFDQKKWKQAIIDWRRVIQKYPNTTEAAWAQYRIGFVTETKLNQLEASLAEYDKVKRGQPAQMAQQRKSLLTVKQLAVKTERVYRTDETPKIRLTTRNIEEVKIEVYAIDMETYFRKMHLARGVEGLDIALIDPDTSFTHKIKDYEKLREFSVDVELPIEERQNNRPVVWAVTISSKTLDATTLVLRSDLDVMVKSSRTEAFVYAQNMRTGKPWANARVLLSNGEKVFAEATTNQDGVVHEVYKELKSTDDVRAFVIAGGHTASNVIGLQGLGIAQGLTSKGFLYTDRPAYRPGQRVHVRGVIRRMDQDRYVVDQDKKFDLRIFDVRGRTLWEEEVTLNQFGSFHANLPLPSAAPVGNYRIAVSEKPSAGKQTYQGSFQVVQYQLEPVHLQIDSPRRVYYRGETITGKIKAAYYYGAPLAGRKVTYQLANQPVQTATTDDQGEIAFQFETREYQESHHLPLTVTLPARNLSIRHAFTLATRGFAIGMQTPRSVYLADETFETKLTTTDAAGKPIAKELEVTLFERTLIDGEQGEKEIATKKVKTDKEKGIGRVTFQAKNGGTHFVRARGVDRFQNPITGTMSIEISDNNDRQRLRILADRYTFNAGETAKIRIHWRNEPTLALITYQGARVLDYSLVELKKGHNLIEVPIKSDLAPNFDWVVSAMTDPRDQGLRDKQPPLRFHEASAPVSVRRAMQVAIDVKPVTGKVVRPGEEVDVKIKTTDQQGQPLAAELSLALIEQALLDRYADRNSIRDIFSNNVRRSAMRTHASVSFQYAPATKLIAQTLLTEQARLEQRQNDLRELARMSRPAEFLSGGEVDIQVAGDRFGFGPVSDLAAELSLSHATSNQQPSSGQFQGKRPGSSRGRDKQSLPQQDQRRAAIPFESNMSEVTKKESLI